MEVEKQEIHVRTGPRAGQVMLVSTPNAGAAWRVKTMFTKEPDTIAWLSSMKAGEVFLDVGANIGLYSLYAALHGLTVYAFEPHAQNYAQLVQNIQLNNLSDQVKAYCAALTDETYSWGTLYVSDRKAAGSLHNFGEKKNFRKEASEFKDSQGCFATAMDDLPWNFDHIKIDVDGIEEKVIRGGDRKLGLAKSVLVEINHNLPEHRDVLETMYSMGFQTDEAQIKAAKRTEGSFANVGNVIFTKPAKAMEAAA